MTKSNSWYDKLKTGAKSTYSKGKEFTEKQIHDAKKKVALNVLDATKKKTPKNERNIITNAKRILAKRYETGGKVGSLAPNLLMELWFAVWERKTDKYSEIGAKLDKERVPFTVQNIVSEDAEKTRSRKAIDTLEVKDRIAKIMAKNMMSKGGSMYEDGGVVGQEIVFDDNGEENTGVIKSITDAGDYIVDSDDGRTVLAQREIDVIELRGMRKKAAPQNPRKLFGFFENGGNIDDIKYASNISTKWSNNEVVVNDLTKYLVDCYKKGGDELVTDTINAIQRAIEESRVYVDKMMSTQVEIDPNFELTKDDKARLEDWCEEIQDGYGWISPEYVASLWESLPGIGTKQWNVNIAIKVYQKLIDEDLLYEEDEDEPGEQGKKIETVDEAIESAGEYGSFE